MFKIYLDSASSLLRIINLGLGWWFSNCPCKSFSSVAQSCQTLCEPMDCSMPYQVPEVTEQNVLANKME